MSVQQQKSGLRVRESTSRQRLPRWLVLVLLALSVWIVAGRLPALRAPIALDDYTQRGLLEGRIGPKRAPWNLYDFIDRDNHAELVDSGAIPWWMVTPGTVTRFLRPLPSLLVWIDHRVAGYSGLFPHVHSFVWWALAIGAFYLLVRTRFGLRVSLFAAVAFAASAAHTVPLLWPANRSVLVTLAFGCAALALDLHSRETRGNRIAVALCWAATFLTGEYALCFAGYIAALAFVARGHSVLHRLRAAAPFLLAMTAYLIVHRALGYDIRQSLFYRNPLEDPGGYLAMAPRALLVMLGSGWFGLDDVRSMSITTPTLALIVAAFTALTALGLWIASLRMKPSRRPDALWLGAGSVLSLLPVLSATTSSRVIGASAIGAAACAGLLLDSACRVLERWRQRAKVRRLAGSIRVGIAIVITYQSFFQALVDSRRFMELAVKEEPMFEERLDWVRRERNAASSIIVLRGVTPPTAVVAPYMLRERAPARFRVLSQAQGRIVVARTGPSALELFQDGNEPLVHFGFGDRIRATPLAAGEIIKVPGMRVTVVAVDEESLPRQLRFEFEHDLDSGSYWVITEGAQGFRTVNLPPPGLALRLLP